jgi:hypothetical protein
MSRPKKNIERLKKLSLHPTENRLFPMLSVRSFVKKERRLAFHGPVKRGTNFKWRHCISRWGLLQQGAEPPLPCVSLNSNGWERQINRFYPTSSTQMTGISSVPKRWNGQKLSDKRLSPQTLGLGFFKKGYNGRSVLAAVAKDGSLLYITPWRVDVPVMPVLDIF